MTREITVLDLPPGIRHRDEIPGDWESGPLCSRQDVLATLTDLGQVFDRAQPERLRLELGLGQFLEFDLGPEELLFSFRIRFGSSAAELSLVARLLKHLGFQALEPASQSGLFRPAVEIYGKSQKQA